LGGKFKPVKYAVQIPLENVYRKGQADPDDWRSGLPASG